MAILIRGDGRLAVRLAIEVVEGNVQELDQLGKTRFVVRVDVTVPDQEV